MKGCGIARDLMPLMLDDAASEESRQFTEEHIAACPECRGYYEAMQRMQKDGLQKKADETEVLTAAKRLKRQRRNRLIAVICEAAVAGTLLICLLVFGWRYLYGSTNRMMQPDEFEVTMSRLEDGRIVMNFLPDDRTLFCSLGLSGSGDGMLYACYKTSILPHHGNRHYDYELFDPEEYDTLVKGKEKKGEIIYTDGDEIPAASDEMEQFFKLKDRYQEIVDKTWRGPVNEEMLDAMSDLSLQMTRLREQVPEWQ